MPSNGDFRYTAREIIPRVGARTTANAQDLSGLDESADRDDRRVRTCHPMPCSSRNGTLSADGNLSKCLLACMAFVKTVRFVLRLGLRGYGMGVG